MVAESGQDITVESNAPLEELLTYAIDKNKLIEDKDRKMME